MAGGALTYLPLHMQNRISRIVGQIAAASQQWRIHPSSDMASASCSGRVLRYPCGRERRVQGGPGRDVRAARGGGEKCRDD